MAALQQLTINSLPPEIVRNILSYVKVEYNICRYLTTDFSQNLPIEIRYYEIIRRISDIWNVIETCSMFEIMRVCKAWSIIVFESIWGWSFEKQAVWLVGAKAMRRLERRHRELGLDLILSKSAEGL